MNAPTPKDIVGLVLKIGAATAEKRISWSTTSQEAVFQAEIADNFVQIAELWDGDVGESYHLLSIRNFSGRLLDQISSGVFYQALQELGPVLRYPDNLENIYKAARWQALGVGDVYRNLLSSL